MTTMGTRWAGGGRPELPPTSAELRGLTGHSARLVKPQSSSEHRPAGLDASLELRARGKLPCNAVPKSWRHGRGRLRTSALTMPPAPMGRTWHLEAIETPKVPPNKRGLVRSIRLQGEKWRRHNLQPKPASLACRLSAQFTRLRSGCNGIGTRCLAQAAEQQASIFSLK